MFDYQSNLCSLENLPNLKFLNHVWFEVNLENDCSFSNQNFWQLAFKQSLELCNSQFSRKNFPKGPTSLLEPIISFFLI